jgi:hypothetical protein
MPRLHGRLRRERARHDVLMLIDLPQPELYWRKADRTGDSPTMNQSRRHRSDSVIAHVAAFDRVRRKIEPPEPLPQSLVPIWREIIEGRAAFEWSSIDLRLAHSLTIAMGALREEERKLLREPALKRGQRGITPNPRLEVVERLTRRILQLQARLTLTARSNDYKAGQLARQRELERDAAQATAIPVNPFLASSDRVALPEANPVDDGGDQWRAFLPAE